jgi:hypothetical protein
MKHKKFLSLLLALLTVAAVLPFSVFAVSAAETSTIKSVEITVDCEIAPVTGEAPISESHFKIEGVNGLGNKAGYDLILYTDWYRTDDPEINLAYAENFDSYPVFIGGYYYVLKVRIYSFGNHIDSNTVYTIKTPTKTYECGPIYKTGSDFRGADLVFNERTEGEAKKHFGQTVINVSGYAEGAKAQDIIFTVTSEGASLFSYEIYCDTDEKTLGPTDVIEKGKRYAVLFKLMTKEGYTVTEFGADFYYNKTVTDANGRGAVKLRTDSSSSPNHEFIDLYYPLTPITDGLKQITVDFMLLKHYEAGGAIDDMRLSFNSDMLTTDVNGEFSEFICEIKGNKDDIIDAHEEFYFILDAKIDPGYSIDGIDKNMFVLNGITPDYLAVYDFDNLIIGYKLPILHEPTAEWKSDANGHWNECACGDKANLAAHADMNNDEKCDACSYDMPVQVPDIETNNGEDSGNENNGTEGNVGGGANGGANGSANGSGLGAGAVIGIAIGVALLAAVGGFAACWFLVKKKVAVLVASAKRPPEAEEGKVKESPSDGEQSE